MKALLRPRALFSSLLGILQATDDVNWSKWWDRSTFFQKWNLQTEASYSEKIFSLRKRRSGGFCHEKLDKNRKRIYVTCTRSPTPTFVDVFRIPMSHLFSSFNSFHRLWGNQVHERQAWEVRGALKRRLHTFPYMHTSTCGRSVRAMIIRLS